jgi:hypothetical protein
MLPDSPPPTQSIFTPAFAGILALQIYALADFKWSLGENRAVESGRQAG